MDRFFLPLVLVLAACADGARTQRDDATLDTLAPVANGSADDTADTTVSGNVGALLAFLNDPTTTVDVLDHTVGLDSRSAINLMDHRNGRDGRYPSGDDNVFDTYAEVDGVTWVGDATLEQLFAWVELETAQTLGGIFEGVEFTDSEAEATLSWVNAATLLFLDEDFGLDTRAARGIVDAQPIHSITNLATIPYIGQVTLMELRDAALTKPSFGDTTEELLSGNLWALHVIDYYAQPVSVHWERSAQIVEGARALGLQIDDSTDLFPLIDEGIEHLQLQGSPSPYIFDWFRFHRNGRELGVVFVSGSLEPVATVVNGTFDYAP